MGKNILWKNQTKTSEVSYFYGKMNNFAQGAKWSCTGPASFVGHEGTQRKNNYRVMFKASLLRGHTKRKSCVSVNHWLSAEGWMQWHSQAGAAAHPPGHSLVPAIVVPSSALPNMFKNHQIFHLFKNRCHGYKFFFFGKSLFFAKDYKYFCVYYIWDKIFIKVSLGVGLYRVLTYQNIKYYWNICIFFCKFQKNTRVSNTCFIPFLFRFNMKFGLLR